MWVTLILGAVMLILLLLYRKRRAEHRVFVEMGIDGPKPHWLWGNCKSFRHRATVGYEQLQEWTKEYGRIYGYFEGPKPVLVTTDLDLLQQVFVKHFTSFNARKGFPITKDTKDEKVVTHLLFARGQNWKRLRTIINPTFSTGKLRKTVPLMHRKIDSLIKNLQEASDGPTSDSIEISSYYKSLTLDVIGESAFGMDLDIQKDREDHPLMKICHEVFCESRAAVLMTPLVLFPEVKSFLIDLMRRFIRWPFLKLTKDLEGVIQARQEQNIKRQDLLQYMIDAETSDAELAANFVPSEMGMTSKENSTLGSSAAPADEDSGQRHSVMKKLSKKEIILQSTLFLLAGYETTSATLSYATYQLALNPDIQRRLQAEIDASLHDAELPDYDKIMGLPYLNQVLEETLRMYPLGSLVQARECVETCTISGITIPERTNVQADVWSIHYDPDIWGADPETFDPDRFTPERKRARHPMAWLPFGAGPRNCVGLRFGLLEAKLALVRVLQHFSFERCEDTEVPLQLCDTGSISPRNGIRVKISARH